MRHLVFGKGEVGTAIHKVIGGDLLDIDKDTVNREYDVIHICFPYVEFFEDWVISYQQRFLKDGGLTIVHASVPVGTCDGLGVVHSPVRGVHPHLEEGVRTFTKFFGGKRAEEAAKHFERVGIKTEVTEKAANTEAGKLWSTTAYGWSIILEKAIYDYCQQNELDYDLVYRHFTETYNVGYTELNKAEVVRPVLRHVPGPIGGHCIVPNCELLQGPVASFILEMNDALCNSTPQTQASTKTSSS